MVFNSHWSRPVCDNIASIYKTEAIPIRQSHCDLLRGWHTTTLFFRVLCPWREIRGARGAGATFFSSQTRFPRGHNYVFGFSGHLELEGGTVWGDQGGRSWSFPCRVVSSQQQCWLKSLTVSIPARALHTLQVVLKHCLSLPVPMWREVMTLMGPKYGLLARDTYDDL